MDWQVSITQTPKKPQRMLAPVTISCWFTPRSPGAERGELLTGTVFCAVLYIFWLRAYASCPWLCLHRFCGGLYLDIKRKLPWFPSDFYEGFHIQSISAILFIYLGCITNAITFGGLLGDATDNYQVKSKDRVTLNW